MKNKVLKGLISAILLIGIIISCRKESADKSDNSASDIMEAKIWYESHSSPLLTSKSSDLANSQFQAKPDWKHALSSKLKDSKTVEVTFNCAR